jgi:hypothetical protein
MLRAWTGAMTGAERLLHFGSFCADAVVWSVFVGRHSPY